MQPSGRGISAKTERIRADDAAWREGDRSGLSLASQADWSRQDGDYGHDADGNPVEARFLDFQLARFAPPATDITCFIHLMTTRAFREARTGDLLSVYHDALSQALSRRGLAVDQVLPRAELFQSYEAYRLFGLVIMPCYHHMSLVPPAAFKRNFEPERYDQFMFGDREPVIAECFREDDYYREKLSEELIELAEFALLGCSLEGKRENGETRVV